MLLVFIYTILYNRILLTAISIRMYDLKYFDYGLPVHPALPIYGLYQPVLDCFLIVTNTETLINKLKFILSSRYLTHVICLNAADNFHPTLIDNSVCENWTIKDKNQIELTHAMDTLPCINLSGLLVSTTTFIEWDILKEKQWALLCLHWLTFFDRFKHNSYSQIDSELKDLIDLKDLNYSWNPGIIDAEKQIMKLLYLNKDFDQTNQQILSIVNHYGIEYE